MHISHCPTNAYCWLPNQCISLTSQPHAANYQPLYCFLVCPCETFSFLDEIYRQRCALGLFFLAYSVFGHLVDAWAAKNYDLIIKKYILNLCLPFFSIVSHQTWYCWKTLGYISNPCHLSHYIGSELEGEGKQMAQLPYPNHSSHLLCFEERLWDTCCVNPTVLCCYVEISKREEHGASTIEDLFIDLVFYLRAVAARPQCTKQVLEEKSKSEKKLTT